MCIVVCPMHAGKCSSAIEYELWLPPSILFLWTCAHTPPHTKTVAMLMACFSLFTVHVRPLGWYQAWIPNRKQRKLREECVFLFYSLCNTSQTALHIQTGNKNPRPPLQNADVGQWALTTVFFIQPMSACVDTWLKEEDSASLATGFPAPDRNIQL